MPLSNIKIIDLTRLLSGPYATMMMSDLGAEVIKIETSIGDDTRHLGPPFINEWSTYFLSVNRNKKSISLNLKTEKGKEIFLKLVKEADVVIENFRPGTLKRLGLSYEVLQEKNPKIILSSISGFGQKGKYSQRPGYDVLAQAMGGLMSVTGDKNGPPTKAGFSLADLGTGMWAAFGIMVALWEREKSGKGQWIDAALLDTIVSWQTYQASSYFATNENPKPLGTEHPNIVPYQAFEASDGHFILAIATDKMWDDFINKIDIDTFKNKKTLTNEGRVNHREELIPQLENIFKRETKLYWEEFFTELKIPIGPVNKISDILNDSHLIDREMVIKDFHPDLGEFKTIGMPIHFSRSSRTKQSFPPELGEHTKSVLEELKYSKEEIQDIFNSGVAIGKDSLFNLK